MNTACNETHDSLIAFLRGELNLLQQQHVQSHLQNCAECAGVAACFSSSVAAMGRYQPQLPPDFIAQKLGRLRPYLEAAAQRRTRRFMAASASFAVVLLALSGYAMRAAWFGADANDSATARRHEIQKNAVTVASPELPRAESAEAPPTAIPPAPSRRDSGVKENTGTDVFALLNEAETFENQHFYLRAENKYRSCVNAVAVEFAPYRDLCRYHLARLWAFKLQREAAGIKVLQNLAAAPAVGAEIRRQAALALCELQKQDDACAALRCLRRTMGEGDAALADEARHLFEKWGQNLSCGMDEAAP